MGLRHPVVEALSLAFANVAWSTEGYSVFQLSLRFEVVFGSFGLVHFHGAGRLRAWQWWPSLFM